MSNVNVLVVDGSHWVTLEDYREVEQQLADARAALRELYYDGFTNAVLERHAAALKAAREEK